MAKVAVETDVLFWALDRCKLRPENLQKEFPKIQQWLTGEIQPTLRQLEKFAKATLTPLGFLFLKKPPEETLPIPFFRTLKDKSLDKPSPELLKTIQIMQRRQDWMSDYLINQGEDPLPFIKSVKVDDEDTEIARRMRLILGLQEEWANSFSTWTDALRFLRQAMEKAGISVVINGILENNTHRKLNPSEFRGFVLLDNYAPFVFINGADFKAAQMFTLAHELAHVFLGSSAVFDLYQMQPADDPIEQKCNKVAAEFLVPANSLRIIWGSVSNKLEPFQEIARCFKVSVLVAARRALDLKLIRKKDFFNFYKSYLIDERRKSASKSSGGNFYNTQNARIGKNFASTVVTAAKSGDLLYSEAYKLTGLYGKAFHEYTKRFESGGGI